ncbi:methylenetetrahydrofolate reductase [Desulfobacula toluolica]|uniref:Methylenetetrahydrofolate reductase n=1 Tax=Desulfobacula toluolica (strain DSM 7467 / Tol2) TaxID=651182 RepID=K0NMZ9_DESTT|nr:methylenetetrahydrofolate reductase [Desulfobacula toluolica]CCK81393.1 methylenetetrahydrofolate reductase [Desulfobacula toluolica Tol2]
MKIYSQLHEKLSRGEFAITGECGPPRGANKEVIDKKIKLLKGFVDAVNVTDNQTAIVRMSSIAASAHLVAAGLEPVMQMVVRDRNRIAIQSDIMGAYSLGIKNILCLSGDHQKFGSQPEARNVFDIDSVNLIRTVRNMRDTGKDMSGFDLDVAPQMFIGAAANPFADPFEYRVIRLGKKFDAGADFVQTQCIYNMGRFKEWIRLANEEGLTQKGYILGGVTPLRSAGMARYMNKKVAGMDVPEEIIKRMDGVEKKCQADEGIKICLETIQALKELTGVHGVHIMAIEWEDAVARIVEQAGLN